MFPETDLFSKVGFSGCGRISPADIKFYDEIRKICVDNRCRKYGSNYACPPAVGSVEECRQRCNSYKYAVVFNKIYLLEDSFDIEGMTAGSADFRRLCYVLQERLKELPRYRILANGGCTRCAKCGYPDGAPCAFPDTAFHSVEGYGIVVSELAALAGLKYINGENTMTYFGMLLHD